MYHKPSVQRFGTFRELTLTGCSGNSDNVTVADSAGNVGTSAGSIPDPGNTLCYVFGSR